jgi:plasmid replication initiation protein
MKKLIITKDNALIRSRFELTLSEQRVILICLGKVNPTEELNERMIFKVTAKELAESSGASQTSAYRDLKLAVEKLWDREVYLHDKRKIRWVYEIEYIDEESAAQLKFSPTVIPLISELKGRFTRYELKNVAHFKSVYAFRIYEFLVQFPGMTEQKLSVAWLREALFLGEKYPKIADLRKFVLNPAIESINQHSNVKVSIEPVKNKREIIAFIFRYEISGAKENESQTLTKSYIEKNARPGETWDQARARLSKGLGKSGKNKQ